MVQHYLDGDSLPGRRLRSGVLPSPVGDRVSTSYSEHDGVVEAIIGGDSDRTADLLRRHIVIQGERFADLMASLSNLSARTT